MQCYNCKHDFCWMCLGDWKTHGSEYYECSRYKENPNIANESEHAQAREALKKYLHYFERVRLTGFFKHTYVHVSVHVGICALLRLSMFNFFVKQTLKASICSGKITPRAWNLKPQTLDKIKNKITQKVMEGSGTWIDWQYLLDASALLAKCRYTLQYTYPYAYYMEPSPRKVLVRFLL